jgi:Rieske Fe-S protein
VAEAEGYPTTRRRVLGAAGVVGAAALVATGCSSRSDDGGDGAGGPPASPAASGTVLGPASGVAVGSATIYSDAAMVVSQPTAGTFVGLSAVCTHQGCLVTKVTGTNVVCPCHEAAFSITDGAVVAGPATRPLPSRPVTVVGGNLVVG